MKYAARAFANGCRLLASADPSASSLRAGIVGVLLLTILVATLGFQNGLGRFDRVFNDYVLSLDVHVPSNKLLIVGIDEESLRELGRWPWPRKTHAELIDRLHDAGAAAIGFVISFSDPEAQPPESDDLLEQAIRRAGNVVLPMTLYLEPPGLVRAQLPLERFTRAAASIGHAHIRLDPDGIVRSFFLAEGIGDTRWPQLSHEILSVAKIPSLPSMQSAPNASAAEPGLAANTPTAGLTWQRDKPTLIPFNGPAGSHAALSYANVLAGRFQASDVQGKIVLVGPVAAGMGDSFPTPLSGEQRAMSGVEILANVADAELSGRALSAATPLQNAVFNTLFLVVALCALLVLGPRNSLAAVLVVMALVPLAAAALQMMFGLRIGPVAAEIGLALCYPLWSWYRHEVTLRYLGDEFARMAADPQLALAVGMPTGKEESLGARMVSLTSAAEHLRSRYRALDTDLQNLPDAVVITDACGDITLVNRAAAVKFGFSQADEMCGRRFDPLLREFLRANGAKLTVPPFDGETAQRVRFEIETGLDSGCDLLLKGAPRFAPDGGFLGWVFSVVDIASVREVQRKREEALSFITHDIRAPQSSILAMIEFQRSGMPGVPQASELLPRIELLAQYSLKLAEDFLSLAKAESRTYELEPFDLRDVVDEAVDQMWAKAKAKQMALYVNLPRESCMIAIDRVLLIRAVSNLIDNAIKFSSPKSAIHVACETSAHSCQISVQDEGPGIPDDQVPSIFEKFKRLNKSGQNQADGAGLGLAFVAAVGERHGGSVHVKSTVGRGSCFSIVLPVG